MALYQQARPITFAQVVGQDHVKDVLMAAIAKNRIGHAYLFSGPRGVGKTTSARLLAMAVNCENKKTHTLPCGACESCRLVQAGNHPDVIELDAASNNSVEDVRDLREKVRLASLRGGMRVWILDEAHMLSKAAANALLKTLEEPPANLIFILATTEPERLPPTILSRCQHYRFRRLSEQEIASKLESLAQNANISVEPEAMQLIARAADGAMRDGESLLERLLSTGESITVAIAEDALGLPPQGRMEELASTLANDDIAGMLALAGMLYQAGFAPRSLAERLKITLRDALYASVGVEGYGFKVELEQADLLRAIHALDDGMDAFVRHDDLLTLESLLIKTRNTLRNNVPSDTAFQAAPAMAQVASTPAVPNQAPAAAVPASATAAPANALPEFNPRGSRRTHATPAASTPAPNAPTARHNTKPLNWHDIQRKANGKLKAFMRPAKADIDGLNLTLTFEKKSNFHYEKLLESRHELEQLLSTSYGDAATLTLVSPEGKRSRSQAAAQTLHDMPSQTATTQVAPAVQTVTQPSTPQNKSQNTPLQEVKSQEVKSPEVKSQDIQPQNVQPVAKVEPSVTMEYAKDTVVAQASKAKVRQKSEVAEKVEGAAKDSSSSTPQTEMGYRPVQQYSMEEELPPNFWDSPPAHRDDTQPTLQKTQDTPQRPKILSAAASTEQGVDLDDVLKHFPGQVTKEEVPVEEKAPVEETVQNAQGDTSETVPDSAQEKETVAATHSKEKPVLEAINKDDAIADIDALTDGVTVGKGGLELDSTSTKVDPTEAASDTPEISNKKIPNETTDNDADTNDKKTNNAYAGSLFS